MTTKIEECRVIELPKFTDVRGSLTPIESERNIPFAVKCVFYLYGVPAGENRAGHAHQELHEFLIAVSGSFDYLINDGQNTKHFHLNRPSQGVYIPPMIWGELKNFSSGAVCLVLASAYYDESKYYRTYERYLTAVRS